MVTLSIRINDDLYYKLVKLKGELKCKNWEEFIRKVAEIVEKELEQKEKRYKEIISI